MKDNPCVYFDNRICKKFTDERVTSYCTMGPCDDETPSYGDKIRASSDEELAERFSSAICPESMQGKHCGGLDCKECWLIHLRSPAEEITHS